MQQRDGAACRTGLHRQTGRHDICQHRPGVDRRQLIGVADQDQPGGRPQRRQQGGHQIERNHRHLIDDDHIMGQRVQFIPAETAARAGTQEGMQGTGGRAAKPPPGFRLVRPTGQGRGQGLLHAVGRLAGECGQGHHRGPVNQVVQHLQQPGDGGGLAGTRPSGDDAGPAAQGGGHCGSLRLICRRGRRPEGPSDRGRQAIWIDRRSRLGDPGQQLAADCLLGQPIALQIEPVVH